MDRLRRSFVVILVLVTGGVLIQACGESPPPKKESRPAARTDRVAPGPTPSEVPPADAPGTAAAPEEETHEAKVHKMIRTVEKGGAEARKEALINLATLKDPALIRLAVRPIRECLKHENSAVRANAALALLKLQGKEATAWIRPLLRDDSIDVRATVLNELGKLGKEYSDELMAGLEDPSPEIQEIVLDQLARQGHKPAAPLAVQLFKKTESPRLRAQVLDFLLRVKSDLGTGAVLDHLEDFDNATTLTLAVKYLGEYGKPAQVKKLVPFLNDRETGVRREVAGILAAHGIKTLDAVAGLIHLLEDDAQEVRKAACDALHKLTNQDFGFDPNEWSPEKVKGSIEKWQKWLQENTGKLPED
jgi:HEAT repeat protein